MFSLVPQQFKSATFKTQRPTLKEIKKCVAKDTEIIEYASRFARLEGKVVSARSSQSSSKPAAAVGDNRNNSSKGPGLSPSDREDMARQEAHTTTTTTKTNNLSERHNNICARDTRGPDLSAPIIWHMGIVGSILAASVCIVLQSLLSKYFLLS